MRSNNYVLIFTSIVTIILGFLLSMAFSKLELITEQNIAVDMKKNILRALDIRENEGEVWTNETVQSLYDNYIRTSILDRQGQEVKGVDLDIINPEIDTTFFPLFTKIIDNKIEGYAIPVIGRGLWSTLYGYLALEPDAITVKGIQFYKHKETPGLGAEVDNPKWKALWKGKKVYNTNGEVILSVIKGQVKRNSPSSLYQVDGLSGATITSKGVTNLLHFWLGEMGYGPYLKKLKESNLGNSNV